MTHWKFTLLRATTSCMPIFCSVALSCGSELGSKKPSHFDYETPVRPNHQLRLKELSEKNLTQRLLTSASLNDAVDGASIQSASFRVSNCNSGYVKSVTSQNSGFSAIQLQRFDSGCLASLVAFTQNNIQFLPELASAPPPAKGEKRVFIGRSPVTGQELRKGVSTVDQLPEIISVDFSQGSNTELTLGSLGAFFQITESFEGAKQSVPGNILPSVSFEKIQAQTSENDKNLVLRLLTDRILKTDLAVPISLKGSAIAGEDFEILQNPVTLKAGTSGGELLLRIVDDKVFEGSEKIILSIAEDPLYILRNPVAEVEIADNDPIPNALALQYSERTLQGLGESIRTWSDESGNNHNANQGTRKNRPVVSFFDGSPKPNPRPPGYYVAQFLGDSSGMLVSGSKLLDWELNDLGRSFAFVIQAPQNVLTTQVIYEQGTTKSGVSVLVQDGQLKFSIWAQAGVMNAATVSLAIDESTIKHYLCVFDRVARKLLLFENGILKVTKETNLQPAFKSSKIGLGLANGASIDPRDLSPLSNASYEGKLATFEIFQGALSEAAAKFHAEGTLSRLGVPF